MTLDKVQVNRGGSGVKKASQHQTSRERKAAFIQARRDRAVFDFRNGTTVHGTSCSCSHNHNVNSKADTISAVFSGLTQLGMLGVSIGNMATSIKAQGSQGSKSSQGSQGTQSSQSTGSKKTTSKSLCNKIMEQKKSIEGNVSNIKTSLGAKSKVNLVNLTNISNMTEPPVTISCNEASMNELEQIMNNLPADTNSMIAPDKDNIKTVDDSIKTITNQLSSIDTDLGNISTALSELNKKLNATNTSDADKQTIKDNIAKLKAAQDQLTEFKTNLQKAKEECEKLKTNLETQFNNVEELKKQEAEEKKTLEGLQNQAETILGKGVDNLTNEDITKLKGLEGQLRMAKDAVSDNVLGNMDEYKVDLESIDTTLSTISKLKVKTDKQEEKDARKIARNYGMQVGEERTISESKFTIDADGNYMVNGNVVSEDTFNQEYNAAQEKAAKVLDENSTADVFTGKAGDKVKVGDNYYTRQANGLYSDGNGNDKIVPGRLLSMAKAEAKAKAQATVTSMQGSLDRVKNLQTGDFVVVDGTKYIKQANGNLKIEGTDTEITTAQFYLEKAPMTGTEKTQARFAINSNQTAINNRQLAINYSMFLDKEYKVGYSTFKITSDSCFVDGKPVTAEQFRQQYSAAQGVKAAMNMYMETLKQ